MYLPESINSWQQQDYLCRYYLLKDGEVKIFSDISEPFFDSFIAPKYKFDQVIQCKLAFGEDKVSDAFAVERKPEKNYANQSHFLHPVISFIDQGGESVLHLLEDLDSNWNKECHREPLMNALVRFVNEKSAVVV